MRLTCPNCDAQYRVPDTAIPTAGRDVECSGCGKTWFQHHPDHPSERTPPRPADAEAQSGKTEGHAANPISASTPGSTPDAAPAAEPVQRELAPEVVEILRQEAERESRLRARHRPANLESQPELGLESMALDLPAPPPRKAAISETAGRTDNDALGPAVLPDTEALNSTLRGPDIATGGAANDPQAPTDSSRAGFAGGFGLVAASAVALALLYGNAARITDALPQAAPMVHTYVAKVDQGRLWLDRKISTYTPN
ncbi:zinc-ribbon domain-containing protein [Sedimentitalea sp. HM32M-2]|uniref:zinc-ribbon domain-containing protein n=1 Tax=Sedimentitalea sp. HM32M-2 TaxID=3351566 RepID=UPI00363F9420